MKHTYEQREKRSIRDAEEEACMPSRRISLQPAAVGRDASGERRPKIKQTLTEHNGRIMPGPQISRPRGLSPTQTLVFLSSLFRPTLFPATRGYSGAPVLLAYSLFSSLSLSLSHFFNRRRRSRTRARRYGAARYLGARACFLTSLSAVESRRSMGKRMLIADRDPLQEETNFHGQRLV